MALTYSEMIPIGKSAPDFDLIGIDGKKYSLQSFKQARILVVMFICNHCPYVVAVQDRLAKLAKFFEKKGVQFVGINSNDATKYPDDDASHMRAQTEKCGFIFPYLIDENQKAARDFGAVCTPDIFVFGEDRRLAYRGRIDDSWKDAEKVTKQDLRDAIETLLRGESPNSEQMPAMGCSIKWKS